MVDKRVITLLVMIIGIIADVIFADPPLLCHPVILMGKFIVFLEKRLYNASNKKICGLVLWMLTVLITGGSTYLVLVAASVLAMIMHLPVIYWVTYGFIFFRLMAAGSLRKESRAVLPYLQSDDMEAARRMTGRIVGRDTSSLTKEGVCRAVVETVAENTTDGVIAPLIYMAVGGPVLCAIYKAVNTMDSMLGYKNDRYMDFGYFPAKLDDVFNFFPARIAAFSMIAASLMPGYSFRGAVDIYIRDRKKSSSPNSAQTESVCAGALGVKLLGDAVYFGRLVRKQEIGDSLREIEPEDIVRANKLMLGSLFVILIFIIIIVMIVWRISL